jgi:hypothetical protein
VSTDKDDEVWVALKDVLMVVANCHDCVNLRWNELQPRTKELADQAYEELYG